jgi:hypothetical protein
MTMKTKPARVDKDGKAIPKTKLVRRVYPGHCIPGWANAERDIIELREGNETIEVSYPKKKV